jgi:hypothetical protein
MRGANAGTPQVLMDPVGMRGWQMAPSAWPADAPTPFYVPVVGVDFKVVPVGTGWAPTRNGPQVWMIEGWAYAPPGCDNPLNINLRWGSAYNNAAPNGYSQQYPGFIAAAISPSAHRTIAPFRVFPKAVIPEGHVARITPNLSSTLTTAGAYWQIGGVRMFQVL